MAVGLLVVMAVLVTVSEFLAVSVLVAVGVLVPVGVPVVRWMNSQWWGCTRGGVCIWGYVVESLCTRNTSRTVMVKTGG